jgi:transposase
MRNKRKVEIVLQIYNELGIRSCRSIAERFNTLGLGMTTSKSAVQRILRRYKNEV